MSIFTRKFYYIMSFLIENNIIEIKNPICMALAEESVQVQNMQKIIDDLENQKHSLESEITVLEENNELLFDKAVTDDVLADLETMRIRANDYNQQLAVVQIKYDTLKAELENLK